MIVDFRGLLPWNQLRRILLPRIPEFLKFAILEIIPATRLPRVEISAPTCKKGTRKKMATSIG